MIVQSDAFPADHASVIVCQMTSAVIENAHDFRVLIAPSVRNGLRVPSQVMVDKPVTVRRARVASVIGRLSAAEITHLNAAIAFVMGLADGPPA